jgi:uncharacterized protein with FMN-binding domain
MTEANTTWPRRPQWPDGPPVAGEPARPVPVAAPPAEPTPRPQPNRRRHPSHGARVVALVSSVAATVGVAGALARADRAPSSTISAVATTAPVTTETPASGATAAAATGYADGVFTGTAEHTKWGDVQVQVTIENGQIVAVDEVQAPSDRKSQAINSRAQQVLEAEAIAAQSADIDAVSGATYTSATYRASLQAALDEAAQAAQSSG